MLTEKQSALRRSQSEATYIAQYLSPLTNPDEDDTQAKNRRAAAQQVRMQRTIILFIVVLAICLLTACAAITGNPAPVPRVPTAPLIFSKDASFGGLLRANKKHEEKDPAEEGEEVPEVPDRAAGKGPCHQCSLNGFCEGERCRCQSTHVVLKSMHRITGLFPIQDRHSGTYHLFFGQQDTAFDSKDPGIAHAVSTSPGWGYHILRRVTFPNRKSTHDPWVVWLPVSELYLMFFSESDCLSGSCRSTLASSIRVAFTLNLTAGWTLAASPVLQGGAVDWEGQWLSNPAALVQPDESITLLYRGAGGVGIARANKWNTKFQRQSSNPVLDIFKSDSIFAWMSSGTYHILGHLQQQDTAIHGYSPDTVHWSLDGGTGHRSGLNISHPVAPYRLSAEVKVRTRITSMKRRDAPALLFEGGVPAFLFSTVQSVGRVLIIATELTRQVTGAP
eukprot:GGOE01019499.1.p1 GENE.GGOE01019499.1~~GGOE01019499.1.p1  ORF type:complete len:447 (+),score=71.49 GGOE01019499.1:53-1393(+)